MRSRRKPPNGFNLRMPPELKQELARVARSKRRSLNAEIVVRLQRSLEGWKQL